MSQRQNNNTNTSEKTSLLKKVFMLKVTLPSIIGFSIVFIIGIVWIFYFGVIVGRGFNPEQKMPGFGKIMSSSQPDEPVLPSVIKQEDLTFSVDLKSKPTLSTEEPADKNAALHGPGMKPVPAKSGVGSVASLPTTVKEKDAKDGGEKNVDKPVVEKANKQVAEKQTRYDYVFKVIAYKRQEQADIFREKLEGEGIRTKLQIERDKKGTVRIYRILAMLRGTEQDVEHLKSVLSGFGINPLLASKKPVK